MPDIETTIYKLELDGSAYIDGADKLSASTSKLSAAQEDANRQLQNVQEQLKNQSIYLQQTKKDLDSYNGSNQKYRQQLSNDFDKAQAQNQKLIDVVGQHQKAYVEATKAAQSFADVSSKITTPPADKPEVIEKSVQAYTRLRQIKNQLADLSINGQRGTPEFESLNEEAVKLQAALRNTNKELTLSANNVSGLAAATEGVRGLVGIFEAVSGAISVFGGDSKEAEKATKDVIAAMGILNGIQEVAALLSKNSALNFYLQGVASKAAAAGASQQAIAERGLAVAEGEAAVASNSLRLAILANPVAAIAIAVVAAVAAYEIYDNVIKKTNDLERQRIEEQKSLLDINTKAIESTGDEVTHLKILAAEYENSTTSVKRKKDIQDELIKSYPDYFAALDKQADKEKYVAEQIDKVTQALILQSKVQAAQGLLSTKFQGLLEKQFDPTKAVSTLELIGIAAKDAFSGVGKGASDAANLASKNIKNAQADYDSFEKFIFDFIHKTNAEIDLLGGDPKGRPDKAAKDKKALEDDFEKRKADLIAQISALAAVEFETEVAIKQKYADKLKKAQLDINNDKSITPDEKKQLLSLAGILNTDELNKEVDAFRKARLDAQRKVYDDLDKLEAQHESNRISLIQDDFEREKQTIINNAKNQNEALLVEFDKQVDAVTNNPKFSQATRDKLISQIKTDFNSLLNDLEIIKQQKLQQLSFDTFNNLADAAAQTTFNSENLGISQGSLGAIQTQAALYKAGKITYKEYQDALTEIAKVAANERFAIEKELLTREIKVRQDELKANETDKTLTKKQVKDLKTQIIALQQKLADAESGNVTGNAKPPPKGDTPLEKLASYADAVGAVADSVIAFWQAANDAESKALDRSIALQQTRVDAAQRIADRGNAQYLKAENDRLVQLNVQRENAARKQLGIDAALQASQVLVGITGAISKIASAPFGAETIAEIAIIIGALATGYGIVKTLQDNQKGLYFEGTKYLQRDGNPSGRDTIPIRANEGEAIIPTDTNKEYSPAVAAIYDRSIPAEHLNQFVNHYHKIKSVPHPNYERIKEAAELKIGHDGRMSVLLGEQNNLLKENNGLQEKTIKLLHKIGVKVNLDKHGFAVSQMEVIEQIHRDKKI